MTPSNTPAQPHHMRIAWHSLVRDPNRPAVRGTLSERATVVGRIGIIMLSCGTGAWRVREAMNAVARTLGLTCSADVGLTSLSFTCFDHARHFSQTLALPTSGVNTDKLTAMESYVNDFAGIAPATPIATIHDQLDTIASKPGNFSALQAGLASALACAAFVFLLGGGWIEMGCTFIGAGLGHYVRRRMGARSITLTATTAVSVAVACVAYLLVLAGLRALFHIGSGHEAGYIGAMLFVIPGFPFITSGLDLAKLDMRSGLERGAYALMVILVATLTGWVVAMVMQATPGDFQPQGIGEPLLGALRLLASFCGVFGFSIMFNSPLKMAAIAGGIGAIANTLRLTLVDGSVPAAAAVFLGALCAGLLASVINRRTGFPRISLTVPAIVIMVPGLYLYRGMFNLGLSNVDGGASWIVRALLIVVALPLGLAMARVLTDPEWRHID